MTKYNFLELAKERKTSFEFTDKPIDDSTVLKILDAARWAPSCTNSQPWHFIVVRDKKMIEKLMKTANYGIFHDYPSLIIACVLLKERCAGEGYSCFRGFASNTQDTFMCIGTAAEHICLEATDLGIQSCLLTPDMEKARKILKVSKKDSVPVMVGLGYEKEGAWKRPRERIDLKNLVSYELFGGKRK